MRSRDDLQLHGDLKGKVSGDCDPFGKVNSTPIAPCGAIANSLFNGRFVNILGYSFLGHSRYSKVRIPRNIE